MNVPSLYPAVSTNATALERASGLLGYFPQLDWTKGNQDESSWHAALRAASLGIEPQVAFDFIATQLRVNGAQVRVSKLQSQIERAFAYVRGEDLAASAKSELSSHGKLVSFPCVPKWPTPDRSLREKIVRDYGGLADLWEASPIRFASEYPRRTELIVDALFPGNPLLCVARAKDDFHTATREEFRGHLQKSPLIVPSPMSKQTGLTKEGRESMHCEDNTGPRRFVVTEFDTDTLDEQAAILLHFRESAPLALVVHSGGKSLHGWFYCAGQDEERLRQWFSYAVSLGADRAMWSRWQFARMPEAYRPDTQRAQSCYHFAPEAVGEGVSS